MTAPFSAAFTRVSIEGARPTYAVTVPGISLAATATDFATLAASPTKVVRLTGVRVSGTATAGATIAFYLIKRSTANTSGTAVALTAGRYDNRTPVSSAVAQYYSANPTLGTGAAIREEHMIVPAATSPGTAQVPLIWDFAFSGGMQPTLLPGSADTLALNFGGAAVPSGLSIHASLEWTEDDT